MGQHDYQGSFHGPFIFGASGIQIKREAGLMKKKYPCQYHAQIEQNPSSAIELVRRHENAAELDVSDELRFGLPSLPIRKRNGTPGRKPKGAGKGRRRTSRP
jgi:hypothetical protein